MVALELLHLDTREIFSRWSQQVKTQKEEFLHLPLAHISVLLFSLSI